MTDIIIIAVIVVVFVIGIRSYMKKLSHGCCGGESGETKLRVGDKNEAHYPYSYRIGIEGMTCSQCKLRVENSFHREEGVWAQVDLKGHSALVRTKQPMTEEDLRRLVSRVGYTMTGMQESPAGN